MKIHKCYFCNYNTPYKNNFINHIMKQNKCSYLIKSIPINSIEEYYKIRDLHKHNPDDSIFGEDPDAPPPKYYNSDSDESNFDYQVEEKIKNNIKYVENLKDSYLNKKTNFICKYCNNNFNKKFNLERHLNGRCKVLKQQQKELEKTKMKEIEEKKQMELAEEKYKETMKQLENKELQDQILLLKSLMDQQQKENKEKNRKMEEKIKQLENKDNTTNNTNNTDNSINNSHNIDNSISNNIEQQQIANEIKNIKNEVKNHIVINNFGQENKDLFNDEERMISWLDKPFNAIPHMIEKLHFTPNKRPENTNIRIANIGNGKAQIYKNSEWKTIMKHELICDLINECAQKLIDTYEIYVEKGIIERMTRFEKFMKQYENDDGFFVKSQTEKVDCKLIDLMKKHKTYLNSLE